VTQHEDDEPDTDSGATADEQSGLPTNERAYIIPATDTKGHYTRLYCRAQPLVGRLLADVHASRKYPFRTVGDLVRYCVVTGAKRLAAAAGVESVMAQVDGMIAALQDDEFQLQYLEFFNTIKRVVDHYLEAGAPGEARRVVGKQRASIEAMPAGYWQDRYRTTLMDQYHDLLDAKGIGAEMFDTTGDDEDDGNDKT
jgi:hypothetical protein